MAANIKLKMPNYLWTFRLIYEHFIKIIWPSIQLNPTNTEPARQSDFEPHFCPWANRELVIAQSWPKWDSNPAATAQTAYLYKQCVSICWSVIGLSINTIWGHYSPLQVVGYIRWSRLQFGNRIIADARNFPRLWETKWMTCDKIIQLWPFVNITIVA